MVDQYAVLGNPIAHSKSPLIHAAFAEQTNQALSYEAILVPLEGFADKVGHLIAEGYKGVNVTVPFKFEAFQFANHVDAMAVTSEASNTLFFNQDGTTAYNTDGIGLVTDIQHNLNVSLQDKRVLLIGAGGAAQGVALEIAKTMPAKFVVVNRSIEKVQMLKQKLAAVMNVDMTSITVSAFDQLHTQEFDVVINATSVGLTDTALPIPDGIFTTNTLAYDMVYGRETPFMAQARSAGVQVADGLGMLIEQAAAAFYLWRDVKPDTVPVIAKMRAI